MAAALLLSVGQASPAAAAPGSWLSRINTYRAQNGLGALAEDHTLNLVAQTWTQTMATTNTLAHNPALSSLVTIPWTRLGENVGYGYDEASIFQAFVNSSGHRANLLGGYNGIGIGQVVVGGKIWTTHVFISTTALLQPPAPVSTTVAAAGRTTGGMWTATNAGKVATRAGAPSFGQLTVAPNQPVVGMSGTPSGSGYWMVASDGGIFSFGDAGFYGSTGGVRLNQPIVGMAATPTGRGYWLVASDGGIFAYGDARFYGSTGSIRLVSPIRGITRSATGAGYRMVAADGGIFSFGDAPFFGSLGGSVLPQPVVAMASTPSGRGYWLVKSDGGVTPYGDAA
jgi:hypothetical protein